MAKTRINNPTGVTHDSVAVAGVTDVSYETSKQTKSSQSDGEPPTYDVVGLQVRGSVGFDNQVAHNQALGGDESNLVVVQDGEGHTTETTTLKNVVFTRSVANVPAQGDSSRAKFRAEFIGSPGASDTPATMITHASS